MGLMLPQFGYSAFFRDFIELLSPLLVYLFTFQSHCPFINIEHLNRVAMAFSTAMVIKFDSAGEANKSGYHNDGDDDDDDDDDDYHYNKKKSKKKNKSSKDKAKTTAAHKEPAERRGHTIHTDNSDFTLNILLNESESEFNKGGSLTVKRCGSYSSARYTGDIISEHKSGKGIVHYGRAPHFSYDIETGKRFNLILWMQLVPCVGYGTRKIEDSEKFPVNAFTGQTVPLELQRIIISYLNASDMLRLELANKYFQKIVRNDGETSNFAWYKNFAKQFNHMHSNMDGKQMTKIRKLPGNLIRNQLHDDNADPETVKLEKMASLSNEFNAEAKYYELYKNQCKEERQKFYSSSESRTLMLMKCAPRDEHSREITGPMFTSMK